MPPMAAPLPYAGSALSISVMYRTKKQSQSAEQREQELEDEVERAGEELGGGRTRYSRMPAGRSSKRS